jgi:hypothetical protein
MPRRPTRSRSSQPTRKQINRRLDELDDVGDVDYDDLDPLTVEDVKHHDIETVDEEAGIVRIVDTGELRNHASVQEIMMTTVKAVYDD